ncbi:MAG: hypothetical protein H6739_20710 [Alphaproteobacteria bacterium]|nr:hypothetical protein [Alphaproteobacteria bacterium]
MSWPRTVALAALAGCYDPIYGVPADTSGTSVPAVDDPTWTEHVGPTFAKGCGEGCHGGATPAAGLTIAYEGLVDVPAGQLPAMPLVTPGDPTQSYLWHKLEGTHEEVGGSGSRMPLGLPPGEAELDLIATWITNDAPE